MNVDERVPEESTPGPMKPFAMLGRTRSDWQIEVGATKALAFALQPTGNAIDSGLDDFGTVSKQIGVKLEVLVTGGQPVQEESSEVEARRHLHTTWNLHRV